MRAVPDHRDAAVPQVPGDGVVAEFVAVGRTELVGEQDPAAVPVDTVVADDRVVDTHEVDALTAVARNLAVRVARRIRRAADPRLPVRVVADDAVAPDHDVADRMPGERARHEDALADRAGHGKPLD